jgi:hypothetical protein
VPKVRYGTIFEDFNTHIDDSIEDLRFPEITKTVPKVRYMRGVWLFFFTPQNSIQHSQSCSNHVQLCENNKL